MKNMGVVMSLSGSIILVSYFILYPFAKRKFSIGWHRFIIIASIVFNIFPFPNFKYIILDVISLVFPVSSNFDSIIIFPQGATIQMFKDGLVLSKEQKAVLLISGILMLISLSVLLSQLVYYYYMKHIFLKKKVDYTLCYQEMLLLNKIAANLNMKRHNKIQIGKSSFITVPMVIGIWNPKIIIPSNVVFDDEELSFILRHELYHIKNHDLFWRFLGLFIIGIHWYNPLSYLLFAQYNRVSELFCDVKVTRDLEINAKKRYCAFLIDLSVSVKSKSNILFGVGLLGYKKSKLLINQRISEVMKVRKCSKVLSSIAASAILLASSLSVLAYDNPVILDGRDTEETAALADEGQISFYVEYDRNRGNCFIDFSGNIYPITSDNESRACLHEYKSRVFTKHKTYSNGSCQVTYYKGQRCTKCSHIVLDDLISADNFNPCPH